MFCEQINVSKIMNEIKNSVIDFEEPKVSSVNCSNAAANEYERISCYLINTRQNNYAQCVSIGQDIPTYSRFPKPIAMVLRLCAKVIRKFIRYIINDQIKANVGFDSCIKALTEHDDALQSELEDLRNALSESNDRIHKLETLLAEKK